MITLKKQTHAIFPTRIACKDPKIVKSYAVKDQTLYKEQEEEGFFHLVFPIDGREHLFLRSIVHQLDKFAPAKGEGVLVRSYLLLSL
jgi:hypothetical protein